MRLTLLRLAAAGLLLVPTIATAQPTQPAGDAKSAAGAARIKVGVVPGLAVNLEASRVDALSQDLAAALTAQLDVDAIGGLEVRRALPSDGIPDDCLTTPACVQDVGKRLGANQLLFVVMVDTGAGGAVQIDSTWVDVATGQQAQRSAIDIAQLSDAKPRFSASAHMLLPDAPMRVVVGPQSNEQIVPGEARHITTPVIITAAATVVGLGVGIGFGLHTRAQYGTCNDDPTVCQNDLDDRKSDIRRNGAIADIGFGVALASAVATTILFARSGTESHVMVAPTDGTGQPGASVWALGRF